MAKQQAKRQLYMMPGCPMAHRATIALREKGLAFEPVFYERGKRPPELEALGPGAQSPTLLDDDMQVMDSLVVLEYLEDRYPEPPLMPRDARGRAWVRMLQHRVSQDLGAKQGQLVMEILKKGAAPDPVKVEQT